MLDECDLFGVYALLGTHRHPDYWRSDWDLGAPPDDDVDVPAPAPGSGVPRRPRGRGVSSSGGRTPGLQARAESRGIFAARRAAARGEAPPPEAAAPNAAAAAVAGAFTGGRVSRGD